MKFTVPEYCNHYKGSPLPQKVRWANKKKMHNISEKHFHMWMEFWFQLVWWKNVVLLGLKVCFIHKCLSINTCPQIKLLGNSKATII